MRPFPTQATGGYKNVVTYTDHYSRFCTVACMQRKCEQLNHVNLFETMSCNQHQLSIKQMQSDNGGEHLSAQCRAWSQSKRIRHRTTVPGYSESNGLAQRMNRTLTDTALSRLAHSILPHGCFP